MENWLVGFACAQTGSVLVDSKERIAVLSQRQRANHSLLNPGLGGGKLGGRREAESIVRPWAWLEKKNRLALSGFLKYSGTWVRSKRIAQPALCKCISALRVTG